MHHVKHSQSSPSPASHFTCHRFTVSPILLLFFSLPPIRLSRRFFLLTFAPVFSDRVRHPRVSHVGVPLSATSHHNDDGAAISWPPRHPAAPRVAAGSSSNGPRSTSKRPSRRRHGPPGSSGGVCARSASSHPRRSDDGRNASRRGHHRSWRPRSSPRPLPFGASGSFVSAAPFPTEL